MRRYVDGQVVMFVSNLPYDDLPKLASAFSDLSSTPTEADVLSILGGATFASLAAVSLTGSYGTDIFTGSNFDDYLDGDSGDDVLVGRDGDDTLIADVDDPSAFGTPGYDRLLRRQRRRSVGQLRRRRPDVWRGRQRCVEHGL